MRNLNQEMGRLCLTRSYKTPFLVYGRTNFMTLPVFTFFDVNSVVEKQDAGILPNQEIVSFIATLQVAPLVDH